MAGKTMSERQWEKSHALVSVIIAAHNPVDFIADAIESVGAQTYPNVESQHHFRLKTGGLRPRLPSRALALPSCVGKLGVVPGDLHGRPR